jgi:UDP-N-acetylglucosamine diphosphorylase/glucosamine-1-phosphate N-acetyltransferase
MVYIYEDEFCKNFLPLVYLRPISDLYCGRLSLYSKIKQLYPETKINLLVRSQLTEITKEKYPHASVNQVDKSEKLSLFISSRAILKQKITNSGQEEIFVSDNNKIIGFCVQPSRFKKIPVNTKTIRAWKLSQKKVNAISLKYLWDLIEHNSHELTADFGKPDMHGKFSPHAIIIGNISNLHLGVDTEIEANVVIDVRSGPVYIDDNAKILALSKITGPCYIGKNTIVDQAKISSSTIGENCRVSGEVEASILHGFVNKHHYGFIGHSYIGEWVNLGAGTTNSDLKNNYSSVKVKVGLKKIDTNLTKLGCFIGDHTKTAIGTIMPTGAVFGIFANILNLTRSAPNFLWDKGKRWQLIKAIETARIVMSRRNVKMTKAQENLIRRIYGAKK